MNTSESTKLAVKQKYGSIAIKVKRDKGSGDGSCCGGGSADPISSDLYSRVETSSLPTEALAASLGCGNPTALAQLKEGETVLDLGSGGGIDVFLAAKQVGPSGKVYGVDMTDEMILLARTNQHKVGATNVEFLKGEIEHIPLPDRSVDVVISNCVINLSPDKDQVMREAFRVLKPGGRFMVSDMVVRGALPAAVQQSLELWAGCIAGALREEEYVEKLRRAGFGEVALTVTRSFKAEDARGWAASLGEPLASSEAGRSRRQGRGVAAGLDLKALAAEVDDKIVSAFIQARRPA